MSLELRSKIVTGHFIYFCSEEDIGCLEWISNALESSCQHLLSNLKLEQERKIEVKIYPDIITFHEAVLGDASAPNWLVGIAKDGVIYIVSPLNPGSEHNCGNMIKTAVHEYIHLLVKEINPTGVHKYLDEGIALFEAEQMDGTGRDMIADIILNDNIPSMNELNSDFLNRGGYCLAYTIVEYIVKNYGYGKLVSLIRNPTGYEQIFGITQKDFEEGWVEFLNRNYRTVFKKNERGK